ncbi:MAG: hypothetical protein LC114_04090 [Bryobacterales bacterium]|nr:hypothetical protein [Bryobacterales bacterium]
MRFTFPLSKSRISWFLIISYFFISVGCSKSPEEVFQDGLKYEKGEGVSIDLQKAIANYESAAKQDHLYAQYRLGSLYRRPDIARYSEAKQWLERAAERGYDWAQYELAQMYRRGEGGAQDNKEAIRWLASAADKSNSWASYDLGEIYYNGDIVPVDNQKALKLLKRSAANGNVNANYLLGSIYQHGRGAEQNLEISVEYYRKAAEKGYRDARDRALQIESILNIHREEQQALERKAREEQEALEREAKLAGMSISEYIIKKQEDEKNRLKAEEEMRAFALKLEQERQQAARETYSVLLGCGKYPEHVVTEFATLLGNILVESPIGSLQAASLMNGDGTIGESCSPAGFNLFGSSAKLDVRQRGQLIGKRREGEYWVVFRNGYALVVLIRKAS